MSTSFVIEMDNPDTRQFRGKASCHRKCAVSARVVGDGDPEGIRERRHEVGVYSSYARLEVRLLVVDRDDQVEHRSRGALAGAGAGTVSPPLPPLPR